MTIQSDNTPEHLADTANQTETNKAEEKPSNVTDDKVSLADLMAETSPKSIEKTLQSIEHLILHKNDFSKTKLDAIIKMLLEALIQYSKNEVETENYTQKLKELYSSKRAFNKLAKQIKKSVLRQQATAKGKHLVIRDHRMVATVGSFLTEVISKCLSQECYYHDDNIVQIQNGEYKILDEHDIVAKCNRKVIVERNQNGQAIYDGLRRSDAESIMKMKEELVQYLPSLSGYTNLACVNAEFESPVTHYNEDTEYYYNHRSIEPEENQDLFDEWISMFQFQDEEDKIRLICYLYVLLLRNEISGSNPVLVVVGPSQSGKSTLLEALEALFTDSQGTWINVGENKEFQKVLGTCIVHGCQLVIIDNFRSTAKSMSSLEWATTSKSLNIRRLGSNSFIHRKENDLIFWMTCNGGDFSPDMENRALFICTGFNFTNNGANQATRSKSIVEFAKKHRSQLLGHLFYIIQNSLKGNSEFEKSLKNNWKHVAEVVGSVLCDQKAYIKQGTFRTYLIHPLLEKLPKSQHRWVSISNILNALSVQDLGNLEERIGGFTKNTELVEGLIQQQFKRYMHLPHKLNGETYYIQCKREKHNGKVYENYQLLSKTNHHLDTIQTNHPMYDFLIKLIWSKHLENRKNKWTEGDLIELLRDYLKGLQEIPTFITAMVNALKRYPNGVFYHPLAKEKEEEKKVYEVYLLLLNTLLEFQQPFTIHHSNGSHASIKVEQQFLYSKYVEVPYMNTVLTLANVEDVKTVTNYEDEEEDDNHPIPF